MHALVRIYIMEYNSGTIDTSNPDFACVIDLVNNTNSSIFLTGKAGTGKSTLLKHICKTTHKKHIVLAPTGIAAVNVGGMTMHSFFKMPLKPLLPDDVDFSTSRINKTLKYSKDKIKIIKELDLIIIDEISMVRADMIDFMDKVLRHYSGNNREPFGGKQLLLVGDIFQLEPVITSDFRDILKLYYDNFFFFNANIFSKAQIVPIELRKTYRQKDANFINLLDRIRINEVSMHDLQIINSRVSASKDFNENFVITLASRKDTVDYINEQRLHELESDEYTYTGIIDGTFPVSNLPTSLELTLKKGAQVVFIRNDKDGRWYNGSIARISAIKESMITVELENGSEHVIEREQWENIQYEFDNKEKRIKETILGTFMQYPIRLAWAMTIHKSQGLTFNKVIIDMEKGAFSCGQTYVALSRCTSLEGITLHHPIRNRDIIVNPAVKDFSKHFNDRLLISEAKKKSQIRALLASANKNFDSFNFQNSINDFAEAVTLLQGLTDPVLIRFIRYKFKLFHELRDEITARRNVIAKQNDILHSLANEYVILGKESLSLTDNDVNEDVIAVNSAMANFNKALSIWPECVDAMIEKAKLLLKQNLSADAEKLLSDAIRINKNNLDANYELGRICFTANRLAPALKHMNVVIKQDTTNCNAHKILALIYEKIGLQEQADSHNKLAKKYASKKRKKGK